MSDIFGQVDVVFVIDTTGSMMSYITEARRRAASEARRIADSGDLDVRVAVVAYRDHPPQDDTYVTRESGFMPIEHLTAALNKLMAAGGGDEAEAVFDGVVAAGNLHWRDQSDRVVFLIGDSPPHGYQRGVGSVNTDGFPEGCPCGLTVPGIGELYSHNHIRLYTIGLAGDPCTSKAFTELAEACGGHHEDVKAVTEATHRMSDTLEATVGVVRMSRAYAMSVSALGADAPLEAYAGHMSATTGMHVNSSMVEGTASYIHDRGIKLTPPETTNPEDQAQTKE